MFTAWKMAAFWVVITAALGSKVLLGRRLRIAVWTPGDRHHLNGQALAIRWGAAALAILLIYQGWRVTMLAAIDVLFVLVGSILLVVSLYIPDASYHISKLFDTMLRRPERQAKIP